MPFLEIVLFVSGFIIGASLIYVFMLRQQKSAEDLARELNRQSQFEKVQELEKLVGQLRESFGNLSMQALSKSTDEFLKLANQKFLEQSRRSEDNLANKKQLIDQTLNSMKGELNKVEELMGRIERERRQSYGQLSEQLKNSVDQTRKLQETAQKLNSALSNSRARGQWGERMAEDVLRMAGFVEGINYLKQKSAQSATTRPDFTFLLPQDMKVNMDVKFPLNNYLQYLSAGSDSERQSYKGQFLRDVRQRVKEVTSRDYINPADNTVDYVLVFIPNEQVYAFINESDRDLLDEAMRMKVILCSPLTLYAVLAIIRQAVENFNLEKTAAQIMNLLAEFNKQWGLYKEGMDRMGRRIDEAQKEFNRLMTTRSNKLEKPLQQIDSIRSKSDLPLAANDDDDEEQNGPDQISFISSPRE